MCGTPISQPTAQGRPRQFCSDSCRRRWAKLVPPTSEAAILEPTWRREKLHAGMRSMVDDCYAFAGEMELYGETEDLSSGR
jgi:hypothetical protein